MQATLASPLFPRPHFFVCRTCSASLLNNLYTGHALFQRLRRSLPCHFFLFSSILSGCALAHIPCSARCALFEGDDWRRDQGGTVGRVRAHFGARLQVQTRNLLLRQTNPGPLTPLRTRFFFFFFRGGGKLLGFSAGQWVRTIVCSRKKKGGGNVRP